MLNIVALMGRLTADPELKHTNSGIAVCSFTVAVDRPKQKDKEQQADFINVVTWRGTAEIVAKYFCKGKPISLSGQIQARSYVDKNGENRKAVEVLADNVRFVPQDKTEQRRSEPQERYSSPDVGFEEFEGSDDDLPFN